MSFEGSVDSQNKPWFVERLVSVPAAFRKLLEERGIPPNEVIQHIEDVRNKAWKLHTYPCLGEFTFLWLSATRLEVFPEVLDRLKKGETLLDFACGFGQLLRYLQSQGISEKQLAGFDFEADILEFGYEMFNDKGKFGAQLIKADMLDISSFPSSMSQSFNMILADCAIHLFGWDEQVVACRTALTLLKPAVNSMIFGTQLGRTRSSISLKKLFVHDAQSFEKLWQQVGNEFGYKLNIKTTFEKMNLQSLTLDDSEIRRMHYSIRIQELTQSP